MQSKSGRNQGFSRFLCLLPLLQLLGDGSFHRLGVKRLRQMRVHACGETLLAVLLEDVGCHGDNRNGFRVRPVECPDSFCSLQTVHLGHHHVHENGIKAARLGIPEGCKRLPAVLHRHGLCTAVVQQEECNLHVELIILGNEQPRAGNI